MKADIVPLVVSLVALVLVGWLVYRREVQIPGASPDPVDALTREQLRARLSNRLLQSSFIVLGILILLAVAAPIAVLVWAPTNTTIAEASENVMIAVLPLIGTWVGTVLAFYFGADNFQAAAAAQERLLDRTLERLEQTPARSAMLAYASILEKTTFTATAGAESVTVSELVRKLTVKNVSRLIFEDELGKVQFVLHDTLVYRFVAENDPVKLPVPTLKDLLDKTVEDEVPALAFAKAFAILPETATLADCQREMERIDQCRDVFLTRSGRAERPIGWVTDQDIRREAQV